jgi:hypothetical protein
MFFLLIPIFVIPIILIIPIIQVASYEEMKMVIPIKQLMSSDPKSTIKKSRKLIILKKKLRKHDTIKTFLY